MILKQLRLSHRLSQEQLAQMSGLNVRTIQRIESGHKASVESLKCLAAALEVDISTLEQEKFVMDKHSENWKKLPLWLKCMFSLNFLDIHIARATSRRITIISHISGFLFCLLGLINQASLVGGLIMLVNAYLFTYLTWLGDQNGIWYDSPGTAVT
ncbi:helix-turn-helix domain-containing protein [Pseudoduganella danionis]|uniref:Helix-turn-helix domain-containing protein n=1 Tax=Pseudoduganella danionis TaxID=1890295 RepID=A0ABW9SHF3_9BURK|nr:helix-turn-helix transcriptional regulator [Pseudoduganella danionis]MTW31270.1 helix-turn-helix domain-containing protein [Pseudoduganella danionis]